MPRPGRFTPGNDPVSIVEETGWVGGPQGRSGRVRKISPPPGFDPRTVQPGASRYTDYAIPAHLGRQYYANFSRGISGEGATSNTETHVDA
jgi:hypothetical protein